MALANRTILRCLSVTKRIISDGHLKLTPCLVQGIQPGGRYPGGRSRRYATKPAPSLSKPEMFCYQCEQTKSRKGCVTVGVCGKSPKVAALQDLLVYVCQGLSMFANRAINKGLHVSEDTNDFIMKALFSTLTNVNFDADRFPGYIETAVRMRDATKDLLIEALKKEGKELDLDLLQGPAVWQPPTDFSDIQALEAEGKRVGVLESQAIYGSDLNGVRYMTVYGLKGLAAYTCHATALGEVDPWVSKFVYQALDFLSGGGNAEDHHDLGKNLELSLKVGEVNLRVLELLDRGHRRQFGVPSPVTISTKPKVGKSLMVSGHDLNDLRTILEVTDRCGVNVYTHGEMMPAHSYPLLREHKSLAGHFGGAWQSQKIDFASFPGPVLVTTNCVIEPLRSYGDRLYTTNETGVNGVKHLNMHNPDDINVLIDKAVSMDGFTDELVAKYPGRELTLGFSREAILEHAATVLQAVDSGDLKRVFVIGGCDGSEHKRNYFSQLAQSLPKETLILTMGCAKYRINAHDYGTLGSTGIPRLLDMGQCNDSYGAVMVAKALATALDTDINSLPLSISLSWFEQKAVAVLLSLLSLGIKNIRVGPVMPAFLTPNVRQVLQEKFNITPVDIRHPLEDMKSMFRE